MRHTKEAIKQAIQDSTRQLFEDSGLLGQPKLYLTRKQYELDPEGWAKVLRQKGLPDDAIEFIPEVFNNE